MRRSALFVDKDSNVRLALRRLLRLRRADWEIDFVSGSQEAISKLSDNQYDAVVTETNLSGMDGQQLLNWVRRNSPQSVRIIFSGQVSEDRFFSLIGPAHRYLSKPCPPHELLDAIDRAIHLRESISSAEIHRVITSIDHLPAMPDRIASLLHRLSDPDASCRDLAKIIEGDIGLSTKILRLVNSASSGNTRFIADVAQAISLIGVRRLSAIAMAESVWSELGRSVENLSALNEHCSEVANWADRIVREETSDEELASRALIAGMLHQVGRLVLACGERSPRASAHSASPPVGSPGPSPAKSSSLQGRIGAATLRLWGFPDAIVEAVAFHDQPAQLAPTGGWTPLIAVYVANLIVGRKRTAVVPLPTIDVDYLSQCGILNSALHWIDSNSNRESDEKVTASRIP